MSIVVRATIRETKDSAQVSNALENYRIQNWQQKKRGLKAGISLN